MVKPCSVTALRKWFSAQCEHASRGDMSIRDAFKSLQAFCKARRIKCVPMKCLSRRLCKTFKLKKYSLGKHGAVFLKGARFKVETKPTVTTAKHTKVQTALVRKVERCAQLTAQLRALKNELTEKNRQICLSKREHTTLCKSMRQFSTQAYYFKKRLHECLAKNEKYRVANGKFHHENRQLLARLMNIQRAVQS